MYGGANLKHITTWEIVFTVIVVATILIEDYQLEFICKMLSILMLGVTVLLICVAMLNKVVDVTKLREDGLKKLLERLLNRQLYDILISESYKPICMFGLFAITVYVYPSLINNFRHLVLTMLQ